MPEKLKKGTKIYVTEGPQQGATGIVTMVKRVFDVDTKTMRWTVWADTIWPSEDPSGAERIKTRLAWVREI